MRIKKMIIVENKKKKLEKLEAEYPGATIIDVTSKSDSEWVKLSPFYPHQLIPIPFCEHDTAASVEGIWQGLKVFEHEGVSYKTLQNKSMTGLKRTQRTCGKCIGHQKGLTSTELLDYLEARKQIYVPTYQWVLEHRCKALMQRLMAMSHEGVVVLLDYDTNGNIDDASKPLSHASLIVAHVVKQLTDDERALWAQQAEALKAAQQEAKKTRTALKAAAPAADMTATTADSAADAKPVKKMLVEMQKFTDEKQYRIAVFAETVSLVEQGAYTTSRGVKVTLPDDAAMRQGSVRYDEEQPQAGETEFRGVTTYKVQNQDCLTVAWGLLNQGYHPAVLNLADSKNPGGLVTRGNAAQEESLFRRSNIYRSLYQWAKDPADLNRQQTYSTELDPDYGGIYTPEATVIRGAENRLLEKPYSMSFITVAAVRNPKLEGGHLNADDAMRTRNKIRTILRMGIRHGHDALVLGALGCGAFKNPPADIANLFREVLEEEEFADKLRLVVFAIPDDRTFTPFGKLFG